jgi:hypothetical protein
MSGTKFAGAGVLILAVTTILAAQGFKVYPGATKFTPPDTEETREALKALPPGTEATYYITNDSFEKVAAFYRGFAKEYTIPGRKSAGKLPNSQEIKQTFFILDGAKDIVTSKSWVDVQRPYIGSIKMKGFVPEYHDVRDVTAIVWTQKK